MNGKFGIVSMQILVFIQRRIIYPWERFLAKKDVNKKVYIFTKLIKDIITDFILYQTILCCIRDLLWISIKI